MTSAYPPPFQFPAPPTPTPRRPLFGKVFAWAAVVFGTVFLIGGIVSFELGATIVGALTVAAGIAYLRLSPARGRKGWAIPAFAVLPALALMGSTAPTSAEPPAVAPIAAVPALPTVTAPKITTSAPITTTPVAPNTVAPNTVAPSTEPAAAVVELPTTSQYVPEPVYLPEPIFTPAPDSPEPYAAAPEYIPEPEYNAPAPLAAIPPAVSYANCDAVRAAGAAPIYAGQPGYSAKLDKDKDGIGCDK